MIDLTSLTQGFMSLPDRVEKAVLSYGSTSAAKIEAEAKKNRPWTDRTAQARQRLHGECRKIPKGIRILLSHGVDYGAYLELCNEKMYAIVYPTLRKEAPKIMEGMQGIFNRMGGRL